MSAGPVAPDLSGELLEGRYQLEQVIGRGAMSAVYRATDRRLGRDVAVKVLRSDCADPERFAEETTLLCRLDHPNLVRLHDAGTHHGRPYLVLNLLPRTLADRLRDDGPLSAPEVARLGAEVASALEYLHERDVVHRDVKPSNILLRDDGVACLADLGAALSMDGVRLTATGMTIGTPMYLAPEQATGDEVTGSTDVYSLGIVLLEAATGAPPFAGTEREALAARVTRPPRIPATLPAPLRRTIAAMVAVDAAARPTASTVGPELGRVAHDPLPLAGDELPTVQVATETMVGPPSAFVDETSVSPVAPVGSPVDRQRAAMWAAAGLLAVAALVGVASAGGFDPPASGEPTTATTTTTVATTTTALPTTTVAVVVPQPQERAPDPGKDGKPNKDDKDDEERD